jgi:hypothetical protein
MEALLCRAEIHRHAGNWEAAQRDLNEVQEMAERSDLKPLLVVALARKAELALARAERLHPPPKTLLSRAIMSLRRMALGTVPVPDKQARDLKPIDEATRLLNRASQVAAATDLRNLAPRLVAARARLALFDGRHGKARRFLAAAERWAASGWHSLEPDISEVRTLLRKAR